MAQLLVKSLSSSSHISSPSLYMDNWLFFLLASFHKQREPHPTSGFKEPGCYSLPCKGHFSSLPGAVSLAAIAASRPQGHQTLCPTHHFAFLFCVWYTEISILVWGPTMSFVYHFFYFIYYCCVFGTDGVGHSMNSICHPG